MRQPTMSCQQARQIDLVEYLSQLGYNPQKVKGPDHWYLSPFRKERTPSFKVNRRLNVWYDQRRRAGWGLN